MDAIVASIPVLKDPVERAEFKKRKADLRPVEAGQAEIEKAPARG